MSEEIKAALGPFNPLEGMKYSIGAGPDLVMRPVDDCARFSLRIPVGQLERFQDKGTRLSVSKTRSNKDLEPNFGSTKIEEALKKAATAFGMDIPAGVGAMLSGAQKKALCLGPDEWLLLAPQKTSGEITARFVKLAKSNFHSLVDVSHRTVGVEISGPLARVALNAGCPLDLESMEVERCTRTVMDKAEIILIKLEEQRYRLEIMRSFAPFVWSFLEKAGQDSVS